MHLPRIRPRPKAAPLPSAFADHGGYIRGLDGLRAMAVAAVVLYHVFPGIFKGGFIGVDIFFVLSGFLITTLLLREDRATDRIDLVGFWARRIRRLIPAFVVLILVVVPAAWAVHSDLLVGIKRQIIGALTFTTNWLEILHGSSYFDQTAPLLFKNFWSLAIEEQFYLFWPLIMLVVLVYLPSWKSRALLAGGGSLVSAFAMALMYDGENLTRLYYGTDTHIFGIAMGAGLAFVWSDPEARLAGKPWWQKNSQYLALGALGLLVVLMLTLPDQGAWAYRGGLFLASVLATAVIAALLQPGSPLARVGELTPIRWVGTRSYGIYLWHWPVLVMAGVLFPVAFGSSGYWVRSIIAIVLTGVLVEASYRLVEQPIRKQGFRDTWARSVVGVRERLAPRIALGLGVLLLLGVVGASIVAPDKTQTQQMIEESENELEEAAAKPTSTVKPTPTEKKTPDEKASPTDTRDDQTRFPEDEPQAKDKLSDTLDTTIPEASDVTAIGDSMIAASKTGLEATMPGMNFLAKSNRQWRDAEGVIQEGLAADEIGRVVVLDFGTNAGIPDEAAVHNAIELLGEDRMILLVTLYSPSTFVDAANDIIHDVAEQYPNVGVIEWHETAAANPRLLQVDATHPSLEGANQFGALTKQTITDFATELSKEKGVDPGTGWGAVTTAPEGS